MKRNEYRMALCNVIINNKINQKNITNLLIRHSLRKWNFNSILLLFLLIVIYDYFIVIFIINDICNVLWISSKWNCQLKKKEKEKTHTSFRHHWMMNHIGNSNSEWSLINLKMKWLQRGGIFLKSRSYLLLLIDFHIGLPTDEMYFFLFFFFWPLQLPHVYSLFQRLSF